MIRFIAFLTSIILISFIPVYANICGSYKLTCIDDSNFEDKTQQTFKIIINNVSKYQIDENTPIGINLAQDMYSSMKKNIKYGVVQGNDLVLDFKTKNSEFLSIDLKLNGLYHLKLEPIYLGSNEQKKQDICSLKCNAIHKIEINLK